MLEEESAKKDKEHWDYVVLTRDQHWDRSNAYKGEIEALKHEVDGYKQTMMMMQQQVQQQVQLQVQQEVQQVQLLHHQHLQHLQQQQQQQQAAQQYQATPGFTMGRPSSGRAGRGGRGRGGRR
eukprot:Hpha_TRINITY_DN15718_c4_g3::TRINITY_DN15718_c4_g3_i1::g.41468::m.41468